MPGFWSIARHHFLADSSRRLEAVLPWASLWRARQSWRDRRRHSTSFKKPLRTVELMINDQRIFISLPDVYIYITYIYIYNYIYIYMRLWVYESTLYESTDLSTLSLSKIAINGAWYTPSSETPPPIYIYAHISLELVVQNVLEQFCLRTAMFPA